MMDILFALKLPPKYGFSRWPLTLNFSFSRFIPLTPPYGMTCVTVNGPNHLDLNFSGNNLNLELKISTCCPGLNSFYIKCLSCHVLVFSL